MWGRTHEASGGSACGASYTFLPSHTHSTPAAGGRTSRALESSNIYDLAE